MQIGFRHFIALLCLFSSMTSYIGRINLSTAIVAMTNEKNKEDILDINKTDVCIDSNYVYNITDNYNNYKSNTSIETRTSASRYDWNQKTQGIILGSFFYGYFALQLVSGRLAEKIGPRLLCTFSLFMTALINFLTPLLAKNFTIFIISRIVLGAAQASIFPSSYAIVSRWIPENERSTISSAVFIGGDCGTIIASSLSGYLSRHGFAGGWPSVFYVSGIIIFIYCILYFILIRDDPSLHWMLSDDELAYIKSNIGIKNKSKKRLSWMKLLKSPVIWSGSFGFFAMLWSLTLFILKLPDYMHHVLRISLERNGFYTALMYASEALGLFIFGMVADKIIKTERYDKTLIRKIWQSIALFVGAILLFLIPMANCNDKFFLFVAIIIMFTGGAQSGGASSLPLDLSNEFSPTIFGIFNTIAMINGFICPLIVGFILDSNPSNIKHAWWIIFYMTSALRILGGIVFILFVSSKKQSWANDE